MGDTGHTDVVVVGAGPVGLTLAAVLVRQGVAATALDALPGPGHESSRATTVHAGTLEALDDQLDGTGARIAAQGQWALRSRMWRGRRLLATAYWERMPTPYAAMVNVPQADTEALLRQQFELAGGRVRWGWAAKAVDEEETAATVDVATDSGPRTLRARYVIGCDGAHSQVRRSRAIDMAGTTSPERFLLADVDLDTDLDTAATHVFVSHRGLMGVMPMPKGFRLNGTLAAGERLDPDTLDGLLRDRLGAAASRVHLRGVQWAAEYRTHSRLAQRFRDGHVLLAGDAAHLMSPVGGQGMNLGIHDALDLGTRLSAVLRGEADDSLLEEYGSERRAAAARALARSRRMTRLFTARGPVQRWIGDQFMRVAHRLPPVQRQLTWGPAGLGGA